MPTFLDTENWMSYLKKDVRILDTVIPASHDASSYPTPELNLAEMTFNDWMGAVTQCGDYAAQLNAGIRYFDMRVTLFNGVLRMKHNFLHFEQFESVLGQIKAFSASHPGEYIFLDLNPDKIDAARKMVAALIAVLADNDMVIAQKKFASAHLKKEAGVKKFNPDITWSGLGDARIIITLSSDDADGDKRATDSSVPGTVWYQVNELINSYSFLSISDDIRTSPFGFAHSGPNTWIPDEIEYYLYYMLRSWKKPNMMISQVINTPLLSAAPGDSPAACDLRFVYNADRWIRVVLGLDGGPQFSNDMRLWARLMGIPESATEPFFSSDVHISWQGPRPNVVFRDMVNAGYNRKAIHELIRANSFSNSPDITLVDGDIIKKHTVARFRLDGVSVGGQSSYLCVDPQTNAMKVTTDWWDPSCKFLLVGYEPTDGQALVYSGTSSDYTIQDKRAFRMVYPPKDPVANKDAKCMTVAPPQNLAQQQTGRVQWGMTWAESQDRETFACLDPDNIQNVGSIYFGGRIVIRSMYGAARSNLEGVWQEFTTEVGPSLLVGLFAAHATYQSAQALNDVSRLVFLHANGGNVFAWSPGWALATTFVIEREVPKGYVQPVAKPLRGVVDKPVPSGSGTVAIADSGDGRNKLGWVVLAASTKYSWMTADFGQSFIFPNQPAPNVSSLVSGVQVSVDWGPLASSGYAVAQSVGIVNPNVSLIVSGVVDKTVTSGTDILAIAKPDTKKAFMWVALGTGTKYSWITDTGQPFVFPGTPTPDAMNLVSGYKVRVQWAPLAPSGVATAQSVAIEIPYIGPTVSGVVGEPATSATDSFIVMDSTTKAPIGPLFLTSGTKLTWMTPQGVEMGLPPTDFNELKLTRQVKVRQILLPGKPKAALSVSIAHPNIGATLLGIIANVGPALDSLVMFTLTAEEFEKIRFQQSPTSGLTISTQGRTPTPIAISEYTTFSYMPGASGKPPAEGSALTRNVLQPLLAVMVDWVQTPTSKLAYSVRIIDNRIAPSA